MSWTAHLVENDETVEVKRHSEGGVLQVGGSTRAELSVTYNYSHHLAEGLGMHFPELDGLSASEVVGLLQEGIDLLGTKRAEDYWESTPGNAGAALATMADWSRQHPGAVWRIA